MWKIIKDNSVYWLTVLGIWLVCFPLIFTHRDEFYSWIVRKASPKSPNPKIMKDFVYKGDKILANHFLDSKPDRDNQKFLEALSPHIEKMKRACEYYRELGYKDEVFTNPTWLSRQQDWSSELQPKNWEESLSREKLPNPIDPASYWKKNIEPVFDALSYYKKALHYSGANFLAAQRIHFVSGAACKPEESIIALTTYIYNTEKYIEDTIIHEDKSRKLTYQNLDSLSQMKMILYYMRTSPKLKEIFPEYQRAITILIYDTNFTKASPLEAAELINRPLALIETSSDIGQIKSAKKMRMLRGKILFEEGKKERIHLSGALLDFEAASEYPDLSKYPNNEIPEIKSNIFEAKLYIAKCHYQLKNYREALNVLTHLLNEVRSIDGREGKRVELGLLKEFHELRRETLMKLGRVKEADELYETDLP